MRRKGMSSAIGQALVLGLSLAAYPIGAIAQDPVGGGGIDGSLTKNSPGGIDLTDDLKTFHVRMAVQATGSQITDFEALMKDTGAAKSALQALVQQGKENDAAEFARRNAVLQQTLEKAQIENKKFVEGLSAAQQSGLKEFIKRLGRADSDLAQEKSRLDQATEVAKASPEVTARAQNLDKALADFYNQQVALGREMGITIASGQDLTFSLPPIIRPVNVENRTIAVGVSGELSQVSAENGQRSFKLALMADLSDLQQNITELLRAQLDSSGLCGQRLAIRDARLTPASPAGLLFVRLHFERWTCTRAMGQQSATELAEGDGTVEIKLIPAVDSNSLKLSSEFKRIDASGMLGESLRSGSLGDDLRAAAIQSVLAAMRAGTDLKIALPPAVQNFATIQTAKFQDVGVGGLTVVLAGQVQISNEQANQLAAQLNQALSAQGTTGK